ncbi:uncharacterized protein [Physcomitrium patens]|uniref:COMM domain-containing protein n=1 Tax=Physcomitrium patens TaxID=3218 RepID=A0A2K1J452_PHYPA|nr:uncharacterized protein LOC112294163 [Physcomitrium patens]PNR36302.1 hypothetical protein PHYPA_022153 [Physcomitrium patens]|eukprot:XP_024400135.1 uncharacterized protein LOC112294163 [Physcomitrella patens]
MTMAVQSTDHSNTPRIDYALPLLDFDWKLKYAVASGNIAAVNKALLRLELHVSKSPIKVDKAGLGRVLSENQIQTTIAEFTKEELDTLIGAMDAIELGLEGADSTTQS